MNKITPFPLSVSVKNMIMISAFAVAATASASLPADHLATMRKDVKKAHAPKPKKARKAVLKEQPTPRMVAKDDLQGDAQSLDDRMEVEAMNDAGDVNLGEATNGTLAMQNGMKANGEINSVQTVLKGWQPISSPALPTVTTSSKKK